MPTFSYRCGVCGQFDVVRPMIDAGMETGCVQCGRDSRRVYGAPALHGMDIGLRLALDAQARSADAPQVVTELPSVSAADRRRSPVMRRATNPRHARLPRP